MLRDIHRDSPTCKDKDFDVCYQRARAKTIEYAKILSEEAEITHLQPVITAIVFDSAKTHLKEPLEFRKYKYIIIDDETFEKVKYKE